MNSIPNPNDSRRPAQARAASVQAYARIAGVLFLFSIVAGGFGEVYVPSRLIVPADAIATARIEVAAFAPKHRGLANLQWQVSNAIIALSRRILRP